GSPHAISATAENSLAEQATYTFGSLSVGSTSPLTVTTTSLPNGSTNTAYSQALTAGGGTGNGYTWSIVSGALPAGLSLSANGSISGTPGTAGTSNFTAQVKDSG